jgi:hypothetical protein
MGKLVLKNDLQTELEIKHIDGEKAKSLTTKDFKYIRDIIKDLATIDDPSDGDVVLVKGYHSVNDGGGGVFVYHSDEPKTNHNGGTIIDPTKMFPNDWKNQTELESWFSGDNEGNGCWKRIYTRAVDIKWFGAKEDGETDDSLPILASSSITVKTASNTNQYLVISQLLEEIIKIDGSGSKIDADLLDGLDSINFSQKAKDETIDGSKTFTNQVIKMTNLPTSDPGVKGQLWVDTDNGNVLKVSQG